MVAESVIVKEAGNGVLIDDKLVTPEEFLMMDLGDWRAELIEGRVNLMAPAGEEHGVLTVDLTVELGLHVRANNLGRLLAAETGFCLNDNTVRAADIAFISWARWHEGGSEKRREFSRRVPDLVVEFVSPGDRASEIQAKIQEWFTFGVRLVWFMYPQSRTVHVYQSPTQVQILTIADELDGQDVLPGFRLSVTAIFD